jgi:hypothetical protein
MADNTLESAVYRLADLAVRLDPAGLERPWKWASYDSEGVRFAFFRMMEELRALAVRTVQLRLQTGQPPSQAQRILAQYHGAWRELQAVLLGLDETTFDQPPAEGEWPVQRTLAHMLGADLGFYVLVSYARERHRSADGRAVRFGDETYERLLGLDEAGYVALMARPAGGLLEYHAAFHQRILSELGSLSDPELELDAYYWEEEAYPLRFRLHRFESHLRQHTVQIEKTLAAIGRPPNEPLRLMRLVFMALAEAEGAALGAEDLCAPLAAQTAQLIDTWVAQIQSD